MPIPGLPFTDEQLFPLQNAALVAWAVLAIAPRHKLTLPIVTGMTLFYGSLYAALMVASVMEGGLTDVFSFEDVAQLLKQRSIVLPVWLHFVVCDLWAGRWEALDGCRRGVPKILMTVPLAVTLLFGPAGLVLYLAAIRPFFPERRAAGKED